MLQEQKIAKSHQGFNEAFEALTDELRYAVEIELRQKCDWAANTFYTKRKGIRPVRKLEIPVVEEVFRKYNIDVWTGKKITKNLINKIWAFAQKTG